MQATPALSVPFNPWANHHKTLEKAFSNGSPPPCRLPAPNPTKSFWIDTPHCNPLAKEGSTGLLTEDADICIIGSGITGVSAAYHLSKGLELLEKNAPCRVLILEARGFC
jgi:FAD dependent oxidoreductase